MVLYPEGNVLYRKMAHEYPLIQSGRGVYLYDSEGRRYMDASGGSLVVNIGHGVESVAQAMAAQASSVAYVHGTMFTTDALETYSSRLAAKLPVSDPRLFYTCSGSEAVETAVKFARQVQIARGQPDRYRVIARWGSYHGASLGTLALTGKPSMRRFFTPMLNDQPHIEPPYCYRCPFHLSYPSCDLACARQLERAIVQQGPENVAAFIAEPVGGATQGGVVPPAGYWQLIREICDRYGVMLIADEVLTGFGRTGVWFAIDLFRVQPDVIVLAKGATGGYFPLSIAAVKGKDVETVRRAHGDFNHGGTFSHHAVGAATALAVMDYMEDNRLVERAAENGAYLGRELERLYELPCVGDVRGAGMMWGIEFVADRQSKETFDPSIHFGYRVSDRCREMGVLLYPGSGCADGKRGDHLMVAPPFVATREELEVIVETLGRVIEEVWGEVA